MTSKADVVSFNYVDNELEPVKQLQLDSGRQVQAHSNENGELIEITEENGDIILKILMTESGPVISLTGTHLKLQATESIALQAKKISIETTEKTSLKSNGTMEIEASADIDIKSENDIRAKGKMIFLNWLAT